MRTGDNIRLRADGRYEARYIKERTESGRAVYGSCYGKTYEEAKATGMILFVKTFTYNVFLIRNKNDIYNDIKNGGNV